MSSVSPQEVDESASGPPRIRPRLSVQAAREVRRDTPLRQARTCYGHLAGVAGVWLMDRMIALGWLEEAPAHAGDRHVRYVTTTGGDRALSDRGVQRAANGRAAAGEAFGCLDWAERRQHLGGSLGRAIKVSLRAGGFISLAGDSREVAVVASLESWLDGGSRLDGVLATG